MSFVRVRRYNNVQLWEGMEWRGDGVEFGEGGE